MLNLQLARFRTFIRISKQIPVWAVWVVDFARSPIPQTFDEEFWRIPLHANPKS
jgi:hypothetical protein